MQVPHDPTKEVAPRIKLDRPHDPLGDASEVAAEVEEEIDACADEKCASHEPLRCDQPQDETAAMGLAFAHGRTLGWSEVMRTARSGFATHYRCPALRSEAGSLHKEEC